jgi:predicted nuclease of restriction endonuclease-like (RecB) superfamily
MTKISEKLNNGEIEKLYINIKELIEQSKKQVIVQANSVLTITYWNIGKMIKENIVTENRAEYGEKTLKKLSEKLILEYGNGFSKSNLLRMVQFFNCFRELEIVVTLSRQFTWSHFLEFIKIEDEIKREFYVAMCKNENWVVRTLRERVSSMLYERSAISKKPEETIKEEINLLAKEQKMTVDMFIKSPYLLDFLGLKDTYLEKDIENAILIEMEKFILEFGNDFAFMARQKRIQIGGNDYYIDLLFYHRKLRRLVLIELKLGEFKPEYKGQVELYLKWLSRYEKQEYEEEPIAIILCSGKDDDVVELMELEKNNIHVSEYWLKLPPKEILKEKMHKAIEYAKARIDESIR